METKEQVVETCRVSTWLGKCKFDADIVLIGKIEKDNKWSFQTLPVCSFHYRWYPQLQLYDILWIKTERGERVVKKIWGE